LVLAPRSACGPFGQGRAGQLEPELNLRRFALGVGLRCRVLGQLQPIVLSRVELGARPAAYLLRLQPQGAGIPSRVGAKRGQQPGDLGLGDAAIEAHRGDTVAVEALSEVAEKTVPWVGGDSVDDELAAGDAESEHAPAGEDAGQGMGQSLRGGDQHWVAVRVGGLVAEGEGELHQQVRQVPRERDPLAGDQVGRRL